jgi:hypothetical protein
MAFDFSGSGRRQLAAGHVQAVLSLARNPTINPNRKPGGQKFQ